MRVSTILRNGFVRDVGKLSVGSIVGRLITLLTLPIVTRLYSPDDFAILASYVGIISTFAVISSLRYEIAIPLVEDEKESSILLVLCILLLSTNCVISAIVLVLLPSGIWNEFGHPELTTHLWLVPFGILLMGMYSVFQFWATHVRNFSGIARTRISQAISGSTMMLGLGWAGMVPVGLLIGNLFQTGAGGFSLACHAYRNNRKWFDSISFSSIRVIASKYIRYPLFSAPEALFNVAGTQIPILVIAANAGPDAGQLFLAMQVMAIPTSILGQSISHVFTSRVGEEIRNGHLDVFTLNILKQLCLYGVGPILFAGIISPTYFPMLFGQEWVRSGVIVQMMVPWVATQFLASPVSMILHATKSHSVAMWLQLSGLGVRILPILMLMRFGNNEITATYIFASFFFYLAYNIVIIKVAKIKSESLLKVCISVLPYLIGWVFIGVLTVYITERLIISQ